MIWKSKKFGWLLCIVLMPWSGAWSETVRYEDPQYDEFMRRWLIRGPVSITTAEEAENADPSQQQRPLAADLLAAEGGEAKVAAVVGEQWSVHESSDEAVDLGKVFKEPASAVAYAYARVHSQEDAEAVLGLGSDHPVRVWWNGKLVHEHGQKRALNLDGDLVPVKLRSGENHLLLKTFQDEGAWRFSCRLFSKDGLTRQLIKAAVARDEDRVKDLLAAGADVNGQNTAGITAYLAAKIEGNDRLARVLEVLGADTDVAFDPAELVNEVMDELVADDKPGIALLISRGDEILYAEGFGLADLAHDIPVDVETKFRIGSVSKQFTAAAILHLQESGKLNVQDPLAKYLPDFPRGDEVTLHHLLTHTSGLKNYTSKADFYASVASAVESSELIEQFKEDGFDSNPGEKFAYCNTGYFLLGHIVEHVSGRSFDEYLQSTFFEPLGMHDTGVHQATEVYKREATGYSMEGQDVKRAIDWDMSRAGGAGNLYSTVRDLHRWNRAVFSGKVLNEDSLTAAHRVYEQPDSDGIEMPYGYGWMTDEHRGLTRVGHSGGLQGFVSQLSRYPDQEVTVVALHNAFPSVLGVSPQFACDLLAKAFLWQEMESKPKHILAEDVAPDTYDDYVGRYAYPSAVLVVSREEDRLMAQLTGQPKFEIFPAGNDKFFWKVVDAEVQFQRDPDGRVSKAKHAQGIAKFAAARIEEIDEMELTEAQLERYVGKYDYGFPGKLTIRREEDRLFAQMSGQPEFEIFAQSPTEFFWRAVHAEIEFDLDDAGQVTGGIHRQGGAEIAVKKIE